MLATPFSKRTPRWRGPVKILDVADAGVWVKIQGQTSDVSRYWVRRKVGTQDMAEVDSDPVLRRSDTLDGMASLAFGATQGDDRFSSERDGGPNEAIAASPRDQRDVRNVPGSSPPLPNDCPASSVSTLAPPVTPLSLSIGSTSARELFLW